MVAPITVALILVQFLFLAEHESGTRKLYFGEWSYATKIIQSVQYACLNRSSAE